MKYEQPLRTILRETERHWDSNTTRPAARRAFRKAIKCRTFALGALLFASENELRLVAGTCKSPGCPGCGQRTTEQWQREQHAILPDIPYRAITLTMPNVLWPLFRQNRKLLAYLPRLGAKVIENYAKEQYGVRLLTTVVMHTFGRHLTFNPHLHVIVSGLGLRESDGRLVPVFFTRNRLMRRWRLVLIKFLQEALKRRDLVSEIGDQELDAILAEQAEKWWSTHVTRAKSKAQLLRYIGRYVRRPPIAEHRIIEITKDWVVFWTKDHKLKHEVETWYSPERFVDLLSEHMPDHYQHAVRHFGLMSPRGKNRTFALIFAQLGQARRPRPQRIPFATLLKITFNHDLLIDSKGCPMRLLGRLSLEQICELRLALASRSGLSPGELVALGPTARQWLRNRAATGRTS